MTVRFFGAGSPRALKILISHLTLESAFSQILVRRNARSPFPANKRSGDSGSGIEIRKSAESRVGRLGHLSREQLTAELTGRFV